MDGGASDIDHLAKRWNNRAAVGRKFDSENYINDAVYELRSTSTKRRRQCASSLSGKRGGPRGGLTTLAPSIVPSSGAVEAL